MSKIIFFDIDGTLYDSRIGIPESTINALNQLIANEHKIVMCTGRSKGMIPEEYFHMGFDGVILGAGTYVEYEGKILHQELMTPEEVQTVIDWGKKQKIGIILEGEKYGYYDQELNASMNLENPVYITEKDDSANEIETDIPKETTRIASSYEIKMDIPSYGAFKETRDRRDPWTQIQRNIS